MIYGRRVVDDNEDDESENECSCCSCYAQVEDSILPSNQDDEDYHPDFDGNDESRLVYRFSILHSVCATVHLGMIIFVASFISDAPQYETYEIIIPWNGTWTGTPYASKTMYFNVQGALSVTHAVTFLAHLYCRLRIKAYVRTIAQWKSTPVRWIEYALSAHLMIIIIAVMSQIRDRAALIPMAALIFAVILCGPLMQHLRRDKNSSKSLVYFVCAVAFTLMTMAFAQIWVSYSNYDAPDFVTGLIFTMSLLFYSFGVVPVYAIIFNKSLYWEESVQCILSLTSKVVESMIIAFGVRQTVMDS